MKVSDNTNIQLPLRNLISIIAGVAVAVWAYFGIIERLNTIETNGKLMIVDVEKIQNLELSGHEVRWVVYQQTQNNFY